MQKKHIVVAPNGDLWGNYIKEFETEEEFATIEDTDISGNSVMEHGSAEDALLESEDILYAEIPSSLGEAIWIYRYRFADGVIIKKSEEELQAELNAIPKKPLTEEQIRIDNLETLLLQLGGII